MNRVALSFVALVHIATAVLVGRDAEERGQNHGAASDINRPDFETLGADLDQIGWSTPGLSMEQEQQDLSFRPSVNDRLAAVDLSGTGGISPWK